jgi:hypothetical protein
MKYKATPTYPNRLPLSHHLATSPDSGKCKKKKKLRKRHLGLRNQNYRKKFKAFLPKITISMPLCRSFIWHVFARARKSKIVNWSECDVHSHTWPWRLLQHFLVFCYLCFKFHVYWYFCFIIGKVWIFLLLLLVVIFS